MDANMDMALQALENGDPYTARALLRAALQANPDNVLAWLLLADVAETEQERSACLERAGRIGSQDEAAQRAASLLSSRSGAAPSPTPAGPLEPAPESLPGEVPVSHSVSLRTHSGQALRTDSGQALRTDSGQAPDRTSQQEVGVSHTVRTGPRRSATGSGPRASAGTPGQPPSAPVASGRPEWLQWAAGLGVILLIATAIAVAVFFLQPTGAETPGAGLTASAAVAMVDRTPTPSSTPSPTASQTPTPGPTASATASATPTPSASPDPAPDLLIAEETFVLDEASSESLLSMSSDGLWLTFGPVTPQLETLEPGHIVIGSPSEMAPYGYLRRVEEVLRNGDELLVKTRFATLDEVILRGSIEITQELSPDDAPTDSGPKNGAYLAKPLRPAPLRKPFVIKLVDVRLLDVAVANGEIRFEPTFHLEAEYDEGLESARFWIEGRQEADLTIRQTNFGVGVGEKTLVKEIPLSKIYVQAGPVPIWFTPVLGVYVGVDGDVEIGVEHRLSQSATITAGLAYEHGEFSPIRDLKTTFDYGPPASFVQASVRFFAGPQLNLMIYDVLGPFVGLQAYLELEAHVGAEVYVQVAVGYSAVAGLALEIKVPIMGTVLVHLEHEMLVIEYEKPLLRHDFVTDTPTPTATSPPHLAGSVVIEDGICCAGGVAGETVDLDVAFEATSSRGAITSMRVRTGGSGCLGSGDMGSAAWEPFAAQKTYGALLAINWAGWYVNVQYRDEEGNLSDVYCDDISLEGVPPDVPDDSEDLAGISVRNGRVLAPLRIVSRTYYPDLGMDPATLQFEVDRYGNVRILVDAREHLVGGGPSSFYQEWRVVDGVVYAGEGYATDEMGLAPGDPVPDPGTMAGFVDPWDVFRPRAHWDPYTPVFPLHAVLWGADSGRAYRVGQERVNGIQTVEYELDISDIILPEYLAMPAGLDEEPLADVIWPESDNARASVWVEPTERTFVKAEWDLTLDTGQSVYFTFDLTSADIPPIERPESEEPPTDEPPVTGETPEESLAIYYGLVDAGRLDDAWDRLSPGFQSRQDGGYGGYIAYYEGLGLCGTWVEDSEAVDLDSDEAKVSTVLIYDLCGGDVREYPFYFYMVYDAGRDLWLIDRTERR